MKTDTVTVAALAVAVTVSVGAFIGLNVPNRERTGCVRKTQDAGCFRLVTLPLVGAQETPVDPGEMNRFPASQAVGDCEVVPCEE